MARRFQHSEFSDEPMEGTAEGGESINPTGLPEGPDRDAENTPRAMPFPGVPVSEREYRRLKEAAAKSSTPPLDIAQEDRPRKKKKKPKPQSG